MHLDRDQFLFYGPSEHPLCSSDQLVDALAGDPHTDDLAFPSHRLGHRVNGLDHAGDLVGNHRLADGLQLLRRELAGRCAAVEPPQEPQDNLDRAHFFGGFAFLDVVAVHEPPVARNQFGNGQRGVGGNGWEWLAASGEVFGDEAVILFPAFGRVVLAEVVVTTTDRNHGTISSFVKTIFWGRFAGHDALQKRNPVRYWISKAFRPHRRPSAG